MSTSISKTFLGVSLLFLKMITVLGVETGFPLPPAQHHDRNDRDDRDKRHYNLMTQTVFFIF